MEWLGNRILLDFWELLQIGSVPTYWVWLSSMLSNN